ncbi:uncharacterized protein LOC101782082 isoform X3 [Setaria italica]|uniref:uncharacterized protein LOC101782082 isoform X3 n=1 Tax=Setaria italica TaxID=4555 RepID=UPI000BE5329B|nr:uncharacterized protein LOC101782082 isoform X3 [Setaria italica]
MALSAAPVPRCRPDARLAQVLINLAKKDLTEVTHKVYFDIEIDSKPAGAWNKGKYRRMEHDSKLSVPSGFQEHDLKLSGAWNKGKLSVPSLCLLNLELMLHPLWLSRSGPFNFESGGSAGSLPKLHRNPYSWSKVSSVIYLDSPAGVGLSYVKDKSKPYTTGDLQTAHDLHTFLFKEFTKESSQL